MLPSSRHERCIGRVLLTLTTTLLLLSASSMFLVNESAQAAFRGLNSSIAFASNLDSGNCTSQTTLTSFVTVYNTTTSTQTIAVYTTSTTLIPVYSTTLIPTFTTVSNTKVLTTTVIRNVTNTASTSITNTQTVTLRTTQTTIETSTAHANAVSTTTLTDLTTLTLPVQVTQTITVLTNPIAEVAIALLILAAFLTLLVPRIHARRFTSRICRQCGYSNPPYVHSFCIKCGNPLEAAKT